MFRQTPTQHKTLKKAPDNTPNNVKQTDALKLAIYEVLGNNNALTKPLLDTVAVIDDAQQRADKILNNAANTSGNTAESPRVSRINGLKNNLTWLTENVHTLLQEHNAKAKDLNTESQHPSQQL